jgi:hypothetical protein
MLFIFSPFIDYFLSLKTSMATKSSIWLKVALLSNTPVPFFQAKSGFHDTNPQSQVVFAQRILSPSKEPLPSWPNGTKSLFKEMEIRVQTTAFMCRQRGCLTWKPDPPNWFERAQVGTFS